MAFWQIFKVSRKTFFNPRAWINAESLEYNSRALWDIIRGILYPPPAAAPETFAQAKERLKLTEESIAVTQRTYFYYAVGFLVLGIGVVAFSLYLLIIHFTLTGFILGAVASAMFFSQAFRFHFWYFQIKNRKLGCTYREWRQGKIDEKSPKA